MGYVFNTDLLCHSLLLIRGFHYCEMFVVVQSQALDKLLATENIQQCLPITLISGRIYANGSH